MHEHPVTLNINPYMPYYLLLPSKLPYLHCDSQNSAVFIIYDRSSFHKAMLSLLAVTNSYNQPIIIQQELGIKQQCVEARDLFFQKKINK